jgi:PilZ domain
MSAAEVAGLLEAGVRVSLGLPESGTCVAVVASRGGTSLVLDLLDDLPEGEVEPGTTLDLFMPRNEGLYHWLCSLSAPPLGQRAQFELLDLPVFVQRRLRPRVGTDLPGQVRRIHSSRSGQAQQMTVVDLSHGGMKLEGPLQLSTGDTIEVTVDLGIPVEVMGRAVMAYPIEDGTWAVHVSFLDGQREVVDIVDTFISHQLRAH